VRVHIPDPSLPGMNAHTYPGQVPLASLEGPCPSVFRALDLFRDAYKIAAEIEKQQQKLQLLQQQQKLQQLQQQQQQLQQLQQLQQAAHAQETWSRGRQMVGVPPGARPPLPVPSSSSSVDNGLDTQETRTLLGARAKNGPKGQGPAAAGLVGALALGGVPVTVGLGGLVEGQKLSAAAKKAAKQALREQEMLLKQVRGRGGEYACVRRLLIHTPRSFSCPTRVSAGDGSQGGVGDSRAHPAKRPGPPRSRRVRGGRRRRRGCAAGTRTSGKIGEAERAAGDGGA